MNRLSILAVAALGVGSAEQTSQYEDKFFMDAVGKFFGDFEKVWGGEEVMKFPSCVNNANAYLTEYAAKSCATADCSGNLNTFKNECCNGAASWSSQKEGCENFDGISDKVCCMQCVNSADPGYHYYCNQDFAQIILESGIICDTSPLSPATQPLPAGVTCNSNSVEITGSYDMGGGVLNQTSDCDFLLDFIFDGYSVQDVFDMDSPGLLALLEADSILFRPIIVNGEVTVSVESKCNIFLSPRINGKLEVNPTNTTPAMDMNPATILYNSTIYEDSETVVLNQGNFLVLEGRNGGVMSIDTPEGVRIGNFSNANLIDVSNSMDFQMNNISNYGHITVHNADASIRTVHMHWQAKMEFAEGRVLATNMTNEGDVVVHPGTECILEFYMNYGTITIHDGAECDIYLNVNEHSGFGTLNIPANGVKVIHGDYVPPIDLPLVEAFGKWTTGAFRAGKSRWVGDTSIDHGDCDQFRFNTLGIRSIVQSPSNETFNALLEISHPKRQLHVGLSYINVTLHDKNDQAWHFSRYLFENSDIVTHLELPQPNSDGFVTSSDKNFRVMVSIDFSDVGIPLSLKNDVEIELFSLRQGVSELKIDAVDCVKLHDVGVAHQYEMN